MEILIRLEMVVEVTKNFTLLQPLEMEHCTVLLRTKYLARELFRRLDRQLEAVMTLPISQDDMIRPNLYHISKLKCYLL
jgi:hypothetical protein